MCSSPHWQAQFSDLENVSVMGDCLPIWWHLNLNWVTSNVGKYSSPHGENVCVKGYRGPIGWQTVVGKYLSPQRENVSNNGYRGLIGWQLRHPILLSLNRETMERAGWPSTHLSFGNLNRYLSPFVYYILNTYVIIRVLTRMMHCTHFWKTISATFVTDRL